MEDRSVLRVLDVNLNRAAEGLRTLEDIARVVEEDLTSASMLKSLRHALGELADKLPRIERLVSRAVFTDVGTNVTTTSEVVRTDWSELIRAASERVLQSLRVLEETSKLQYVELAAQFKQLRYRAYDCLATVEQRFARSAKFLASQLYLLIGCDLPLEQFCSQLTELQHAGVGLFQLRDKRAEAAKLLEYARAAVESVGSERVVINDRVDIALACGAGSVHIGQDDLPIQHARKLAGGTNLWIGVSTHDIEQAKQAEADGADYIGCGPTFPSSTKQFTEFAGLEFLAQVARQIQIPSYAIGGITANNVEQVAQTGITRVAVSGAVLNADNPSAAALQLSQWLVANKGK